MSFPTNWTPEDDAMLREGWDRGDSAGVIGKRLNRTPNSVIGRKNRLDLKDRPSPIIGGKVRAEEKCQLVAELLRNGMSVNSVAKKAHTDPRYVRNQREEMQLPVYRQATSRGRQSQFQWNLFDNPADGEVIPMVRFKAVPFKKYVPKIPGTCCWLEGERSNYVECTAPAYQGSSWCAEHRAVCFVPRRIAA